MLRNNLPSVAFSVTLVCMAVSRIFRESLRHANTLLFLGGFIFDLLILPEAGHTLTIILGTVYLSIVAVGSVS